MSAPAVLNAFLRWEKRLLCRILKDQFNFTVIINKNFAKKCVLCPSRAAKASVIFEKNLKKLGFNYGRQPLRTPEICKKIRKLKNGEKYKI